MSTEFPSPREGAPMPNRARGLDSPAVTGLGLAGTRNDTAHAHSERGLDAAGRPGKRAFDERDRPSASLGMSSSTPRRFAVSTGARATSGARFPSAAPVTSPRDARVANGPSTAVEDHSVHVDALTSACVREAALYTESLAMLVAAGFSEDARTFPTRPVMLRLT